MYRCEQCGREYPRASQAAWCENNCIKKMGDYEERMIEQDIDQCLRAVADRHDVHHVLACFREMGACLDDIETECKRLCSDAKYCREWATATGFYDNMRRY